jgi:RNA polymerase sigma-54 factor
MGLSQKIAMRQSQSLVMTPQLSQSIKLLTMSNIELAAFVESELERNPFLENDIQSDNAPAELREQTDAPSSDSETPRSLTDNDQLETSASSLSENLGTSLENEFPDEQDYRKESPEKPALENSENHHVASDGIQISGKASVHDQQVSDYTADAVTLRDHLNEQLAMSGASKQTNLITRELIDGLDEAGYLRVDLTELAERLGTTEVQMGPALALLQSFEPCGIGARNLAECLRLQLVDLKRLDPGIECIIDNIDLLAKRDFESLKQISGLDIEDLHDALVEIQTLDPKPGTAFESGPVQHVVPDVFVTEANDGSWNIELNSDTLPRVLVNNTYATNVSDKLSKDSDKEFLAQCLQTASWLTKSLDQRAQTILKTAKEIVKQQDAFLVHGIQQLRPLTLKTVADEIEMHESSVSRVTSNKYMMTPRGLFELKYFFTTNIASTEDGEGHSSAAVRARIKDMIDNETAAAVLSDDSIVMLLKSNGIDIARRTIAKYRESMNIPSSVQRRREKKAAVAAIASRG